MSGRPAVNSDRPGKGKSVRVLILSHMYPRARHPAGGIFVHDQVRALRDCGIDARVLSGDPFWLGRTSRARYRARASWGDWDSVPVLHFPYLCGAVFRPSLHAITYVHGLKRVLAAVCAQFSFDIVHAHTSFLDGSAGLVVRRITGRPLVITEHTGPFSLLTSNWLMRRTTRRALTGADLRLAVSGSLRRDMIDALGLAEGSIEVLPNGFDPRVFCPNAGGRDRRPDGLIRALWVGHHVEIKRVDRLLQAFAQASRQRPELRLTLLGEGPERRAMEDLAHQLGLADKVAFRPAADRRGVADAMRAHDFLVVASAKETFSLVTVEALACGIPVLATACGGPESLITDPAFGLVVANDVDGLAQGLIAMPDRLAASDPVRLHDYFASRYSWTQIAGQLVAHYQKLVASPARRTA